MTTVTLLVPNSGYPDEEFNINLGSDLYTLRFRYNFRYDFWTLTVKEGTKVLFQNVKIVSGLNIGEIYSLETNIPGTFFVSSVSNSTADPTINNFGSGKDLSLHYSYDDGSS